MKADLYVADSFGDQANVYVKDDINSSIHFATEDDLLIFTPEQARELASVLIEAANKAEA